MAALDLFGRRWMLRVMWELRDGPAGFRVLLARCEGISNAVLITRAPSWWRAGSLPTPMTGRTRC